MRTTLAIAPLDPRVASRLATRRARQELAALYESRADWEHREGMREWQEQQQRQAERDEADARRRDEEHRRDKREHEAAEARARAAKERRTREIARMADAKRRTGMAIFALVTLCAAAWWGKDRIAEVVNGLRAEGVKLPVFHVDLSTPSPEALSALHRAVYEIVEGEDDAVIDRVLGDDEDELRARLATLTAEAKGMVQGNG